jgi:hypothetical protein
VSEIVAILGNRGEADEICLLPDLVLWPHFAGVVIGFGALRIPAEGGDQRLASISALTDVFALIVLLTFAISGCGVRF